MLSISSIGRSSLEVMLESLKQRDENEKPKDLPPALPTRPKLKSKTRPPSPKTMFIQNGDVVRLENRSGIKVKGISGAKLACVDHYVVNKIAALEVQKCFRGHRARRHFHELKGGVIILQSFIRGEMARRQYSTKVGSKGKVDHEGSDEHLVAVVQIQSAIRGCLARRDLSNLQNSNMLTVDTRKAGRKMEVKELPREILPSVVEDLERRVLKAEATLEQKEKENAALKKQVKQFEARCLEYEVKMRSMEEMWQKQTASLQASLAAAKNSLGAGDTTGRPAKLEGSPSPHYYDSDNATSMDTPAGHTPVRFSNNSFGAGANKEVNGGLSLLSHLTMEFEQRKQNFDDEAKAIVHLKPGQLHSTNPADEYRRLKHRFEEWKKDYKVRLKETKIKVHKLAQSKAGKNCRKWWGKKSK